MLVRPCLLPRTAQPCLRPHHPTSSLLLTTTTTTTTATRHFHPSPPRTDDHRLPNHYETLDLPINASPGEIKKRFYALSKSHHPDLHPTDPHASARFVRISEAYATLGSPEKRARYDRDFLRSQPSHSHSPHSGRPGGGSYSSASTPAGGRPASGLSRRRTQFRGPPPSFYASGGWGAQGEKRAEHARASSHAHEAGGASSSSSAGAAAGTGPGGFASGFDSDVPHFNHTNHFRTHSQIERTRHRARRKADSARVEAAEEHAGTSTGWGFFMLCGVLAAVVGVPVAAGRMLGEERGNGNGRLRRQREG